MISNRTLAVAAILALAIPAVGAAAPIVQPPVPETLVEGHTVFTVITQNSNVGPLPLPDLDLNLSLDLDVFSNLTVDLCVKVGILPEVNGTITDEEQVNASGNATVGPIGGPIGPTGTGPVTAPPTQPLPPRDETCTRPRRPNTTTVVEEFAAAVAVLVREYNPNQQDKLFINATVDLNANVNETVTSDSDVCTDFGLFPCVRRGNNGAWSRFPGVLWFNDQYLVGPSSSFGTNDQPGSPFDAGFGPVPPPTGAGTGRNDVCVDIAYQRSPPQADIPCDPAMDAGTYFRYPCGGAVLAVRAGQPDPREVILNARNTGSPADGSYPGTSGGTSDDFAWIGLDATATDPVSTTGGADAETFANDVIAGLADGNGDGLPDDPFVALNAQSYIDYVESYLITDPNDHSWVIDLYQARTQTFLPSGDQNSQKFYIWAVNTLGTPVFVPDEGQLNCMPFEDLLSSVEADADGDGTNEVDGDAANDAIDAQACDQLVEENDITGEEAGPAPANANNAYLTAKDDPCAGYKEPSDGAAAYCYGGQAQGTGTCANRDDPTAPNYTPLRLYNALLYFQSDHLGVMDSSRAHGVTSSDTNGCQVGTEWACPAGDDNAEGNSHPFHPDTHASAGDAQDCPRRDLNGDGDFTDDGEEGFQDNAGGNHGGSATPTDVDNVGQGVDQDGDGLINDCDFTHALWNIDIYFSANGRPLEPVVRQFDVIDTEGSNAAFSQTEQPGHP